MKATVSSENRCFYFLNLSPAKLYYWNFTHSDLNDFAYTGTCFLNSFDKTNSGR
jgi:hypothetical protein